MFSERNSRLAFQTIAVLFFLYQMQQSIMKYSYSPTSVIKLNVPNKGMVYEPDLVVCQTSQFNYSKAKRFGYQWMTRLWGGILESNDGRKMTWKGKTGNLSFSTISEELYDYDYADIAFDQGKLGEQYLSLNFGMCVQLDDLGNDLSAAMYTNKTLMLLAVDPKASNKVRIDPKASVTVGPRYDGMYDWANVLVEYTVTDNSINDGVGCKVYEYPNTYEKCFTKALQVNLHYNFKPKQLGLFLDRNQSWERMGQ